MPEDRRTWTPSGLRLAMMALSAALFIAACFLPVGYVESGSPVDGGMALVFGPLTVLLGGAERQLGWLANPLLLIGWLSLATGAAERRRGFLIVSLLAAGLALSSYLTLPGLHIPEGIMSGAPIVRFGLGIHLWVASILIMTLSHLFQVAYRYTARKREAAQEEGS